ncbi:S41 family peptidase [Deinococcus rubellus]|uniref:S41 family peptidase n=1 Tax=Deinococcus rubellus TaxID=1889240 RepID=A0ABY5YJD0_9DEIO|nr:S41 family peptidase [Deinococcus rubellus]UWX64903.1 S41 family peptidase [Deinococcus rubellus]
MIKFNQTGRAALGTLVLCAALLSSAQASPAQTSPAAELFNRASDLFQSEYYGWSDEDRSTLVSQYAAELQTRCAPEGEACSFETGRAVLTEMFDHFHDDHTSVRDAETAQRLMEIQNDLSVPRTGARVIKQPEGLLVVGVQAGSPAEQAGVKLYDLITSVNGEVAGKDQAVDSLAFVRLERAAQPLALVIQRPGTASLNLSITPTEMKARDEPSLSYPAPGVALINFPTFLSGDSAPLFLERIKEAQATGAHDLIIDLRYNGGGRLDQCVAAASIFKPVVYQARFRGGGWSFGGLGGEQAPALSARIDHTSHVWNGPAAILVGENTASCAEVFTFFAQKTGVKVIGTATKGVGNSGVNFFPLPDHGILSLTMLRAFDETGAALPDHITPDISAPTDIQALIKSGNDTTLDAALKALGVPGPAATGAVK